MAADKNCILLTTLESRFLKSNERIKAKNPFSQVSSKRRMVKLFVFRFLKLSLRKS